MEAFFKAQGFKGVALKGQLAQLKLDKPPMRTLEGMELADANLEADLAWQVRAWGWWVLQQAKKELAPFLSHGGRQADGGLPLGADGDLQELPGYRPSPQDPVAVQKRQQVGAAHHGAQP